MDYDFATTSSISDAYASYWFEPVKRHPSRLVPRKRVSASSSESAPTDSALEDVAVLPGQVASTQAIERSRDLLRVFEILRRFSLYGYSTTGARATKVSGAAVASAKAFLSALPADVSVPKVAPEGDDGVLLVWEERATTVLVMLDGSRLFAVKAPGAAESAHFDLAFEGDAIPAEVLAILAPTN